MEEAKAANNLKVMAVLKKYLLKAGGAPSTSLEVQPISEESETSVNAETQK